MNIVDNGLSFTINGREVEKLHVSHKVVDGIIVIPHIGPGRVAMWKAAETYGPGRIVWIYDNDGELNAPHRVKKTMTKKVMVLA